MNEFDILPTALIHSLAISSWPAGIGWVPSQIQYSAGAFASALLKAFDMLHEQH